MSESKINNIAKPLKWPVKDEIGYLIEDYNKLMRELEIRTQQLIKSEKEGQYPIKERVNIYVGKR